MTPQRSSPARQYHDGCAAAHALDLVGERWALLVVRELLLGPRRFSDLRADLPGISPNVLSQRLKDLEDIGVIFREQLPPPAANWVYALSAWGRELEPVLQQLGRWGARSSTRPQAPISLATLVTAMTTMFHPPAAQNLSGTVALLMGRERFQVQVEEGKLEVRRGVPVAPDVILEADVQTLGGLLFGDLPLEQAEAQNLVVVEGSREWAERFLSLFQMPEVVAGTR
ncbi:winged helix-turn-helix transcriptional regulator [Deinococcus altitudinis]|uniref:winged helix-turn-helix transcriptional regulator n=1 Tax=Deinococcus altitudinis TaxID=468914 RepID=UPI003891526E